MSPKHDLKEFRVRFCQKPEGPCEFFKKTTFPIDIEEFLVKAIEEAYEEGRESCNHTRNQK